LIDVVGSIVPAAYDIYQEGLRIPPLKLFRAGELNQDLADIMLLNSRIPQLNWGDLKALFAALTIAERRLGETISRYGLARVKQGAADLLDYAEDRARRIIREIPDGTYTFADYMELDLIGDPPARIKLTMTVADSDIELDFTGTDPQVRAALNLPSAGKNHHFITGGIVNFFLALDREIPLNKGILRPFRVKAPEGSIVNCVPPASVGVRFATGVRILENLMATLSMACSLAEGSRVAGVVPAAGSGQLGVTLLSMLDQRTGRQKVNVVQPLWGGSGARPVKDGLDGADFPAGYLRNIPIEAIETEMPVLVHRYQLAPGPPPAGKWRGGLGIELKLQIFTPNTIMTARGMERFLFRPWGRAGGAPGSLSTTRINPGTDREADIGKINVLQLQPGDVVQIVTSSGGGYGDPVEREPALVLRDVRDGLLTQSDAESTYGVVIKDGQINLPETTERRADLAANRPSSAAFTFGPEREAYEASFPQSLQDRLSEALLAFPIPQRHYFRRRVWQEVTKDNNMETHWSAKELGDLLVQIRGEMKSELMS
jgi:N-methylhydantoinase B